MGELVVEMDFKGVSIFLIFIYFRIIKKKYEILQLLFNFYFFICLWNINRF